jgi:hypothetical protein
VCDLSYAIQVEAIERAALAEMTLAPHVKEGTKIDTPDTAVTEFDEWLWAEPENTRRPEDMELMDLIKGR